MLWKTLERRIRQGTLTIHFPDGTRRVLGSGEPDVHIRMRRNDTLRRILLYPPMNLGTTYMDGGWDPEGHDLRPFFRLIMLNLGVGPRSPAVRKLIAVVRRIAEINWPWRSLRNVSHHYDLDRRLFRKFLDSDLQYSCAYFRQPDDSLEQAQTTKREHIARKLLLNPGARVLDIGCGWGGLALHLAEHHGARVTGLTLSREQLDVARERARERGLEDRVEFRLQDYRQHEDEYDAIVSVGMFEHVGRPQYQQFFDQVAALLKSDGTALLHTIGRTGPPTATNPWIARHIFPGGYIPALSEVSKRMERSTLKLADLEVLRLHYANTLAHWNERFQQSRGEFATALGEEFCRMWEFYLQLSESAFRWSDLVVFQFQLSHRNNSVPLTRDYLYHDSNTANAGEARVVSA